MKHLMLDCIEHGRLRAHERQLETVPADRRPASMRANRRRNATSAGHFPTLVDVTGLGGTLVD